MYNLSISKQREILIESKQRYKIYQGPIGMCWCIELTLLDYGYNSSLLSIDEFIPSFNYKNVLNLSKKYNFKEPLYSPALNYWWDIRDFEIRNKVFDILINNLKSNVE